MGSVGEFLGTIKGVLTVLVVYGFMSPVIDILISINMSMGGHNANIASMIDFVVYVVVPILLIISYGLYSFIASTKEDNPPSYNRW